MMALEALPEWRETAARASYRWPTAQRDELVAWLWSRPEPALRILADVIERPTLLDEARP